MKKLLFLLVVILAICPLKADESILTYDKPTQLILVVPKGATIYLNNEKAKGVGKSYKTLYETWTFRLDVPFGKVLKDYPIKVESKLKGIEYSREVQVSIHGSKKNKFNFYPISAKNQGKKQ